MSVRTSYLLPLLSLVLVFAACDKKDASLDQAMSKAKDATEQVRASAGELSSSVAKLSQDEVEEVAKVAALLETAPEEAKKKLAEHGWSKDQFDKMVAQIQDNEATKALFEKAKAVASQH